VAVLGEVQGVLPAIPGAAAALDKAPAFEVVDQGDEAAGVDAEVLGDGVLAAAGLGSDDAQQPTLRRGQSEWGDPVGEPAGGVRAELGQQERRSRRPPRWSTGGLSDRHAITVSICNRSC